MRARLSALLAATLVAFLAPTHIPASHAAVADGVGVVTSSLLMYYDLGNVSGIGNTTITSGSTLLTDLAGNNYSGKIWQSSSQPTFNSAQGKYLNFTNSGGYVDLPDITSPSIWSGLTISFYANWGSVNNFERIIDFGNGAASHNILIGRDGGSNAAFLEVYEAGISGGYCRSGPGSVNANVSSGNGFIPVNTWSHWTVTLGGGYCTWYRDGVQTNQSAYTRMPQAVTLTNNYIGKSNWVDPYFEGGIADLAIYKAVLNSTQITQNYTAQTDITPPSISDTYLSSPENQLAISTLNAGVGTVFSTRAGLDTAKLSLSSSGSFAFTSNPNYEARDSYNGTFQYALNARATDPNGNYLDFYLQVSVLDMQESAVLSAPTLSGTPSKGVSLTITVTPTGDGTSIPGKVSFFIAGKRIPGCYKKNFSGTGNATCSWKPLIQGNREISATFTPTNTNYTAITNRKNFLIYKRTNSR